MTTGWTILYSPYRFTVIWLLFAAQRTLLRVNRSI